MMATTTAITVSDFISLLMTELMVSEVIIFSSTPNLSTNIWFSSSLCSTFRVEVLKMTSLES